MGAEVQSWHYDPAPTIVTLKIANSSHKDITAFNIAIKEAYADGHVNNHELLSDFVGCSQSKRHRRRRRHPQAIRRRYVSPRREASGKRNHIQP